MDIQAAVAHGQGDAFERETVQLDEPRAGEVLVRIVPTGVCHTDAVARDEGVSLCRHVA